MKTYRERIKEREAELDILKSDFAKMRKVMETLEIGEIVYICGGHGGYDVDFFSQIIQSINLEECSIEVYEKSINRHQTLLSFHRLENEKFEYYS